MKPYFFTITSFLVFLYACKVEESQSTENLTPWKASEIPSHFAKPLIEDYKNVTEASFLLGRKLFYDPMLSRDGTIACGSCHIQATAFTHHGHETSHGINDLLGRRNTPAIQNVLWQPIFFWDGGVSHLDFTPLNALENPVEMDTKLSVVLEKLKQDKNYPDLFQKAFQKPISSETFLKAMNHFMVSLISATSKYDRYRLGKENLTDTESQGLDIFAQKCASCHAGETFTDYSFRNNGLTDDFTRDKGRFEISTFSEDIGKFKVPSLRNVARSAPYMHTGKIATLAAVLEHYASGVKDSPTLDASLKKEGKLGIPLTAQEKEKLIAFLQTLTDVEFISNPLFSEYLEVK